MTQKTCELCNNDFEISLQEQKLLEDISPIIAQQKHALPLPDRCPPCRRGNRILFKNLRHLFKRTCDFSGKSLISPYSQDCGMTVYDASIWWSDVWDAMDYGQEIDWSRPFFEQFETLFRRVPVFHIAVAGNEGCDFVNGCANCKNCYLGFNMDYCENVLYSQDMKYNKDCMDCESVEHSELCYWSTQLRNCYQVLYGDGCIDCSFSTFIADCRSTRHCIACVGITHGEFMVLNKLVSEEEFRRVEQTLRTPAGLTAMAEQFALLRKESGRQTFFGANNEGCSGNSLFHVRESYDCFDSENLDNCMHCSYVFNAKNCLDYDVFGDNSSWIYNCESTGINCSNLIGCLFCLSGCSNLMYCSLMVGSQDCFGCSGLKHKQYCVFNKQYSKEEYEELVPRLIAHMRSSEEWGKYFPGSMSPFAYNMLVNEYLPRTKEQVESFGWKWDDTIPSWEYLPTNSVSYSTVLLDPDSIDLMQNTINTCPISGKSFKYSPYELSLYLKLGLPASTLHPDVRHTIRRRCMSSYFDVLQG